MSHRLLSFEMIPTMNRDVEFVISKWTSQLFLIRGRTNRVIHCPVSCRCTAHFESCQTLLLVDHPRLID